MRRCELRARVDPDEQLIADLVAPRYSIDSKGRGVVEPKAESKRRLGRSPDRADAVLMAFAIPPASSTGAGIGHLGKRDVRGRGPDRSGSLADQLAEARAALVDLYRRDSLCRETVDEKASLPRRRREEEG